MEDKDMELLKQLYSIHSPSGGEKKMRKFIKNWVRRNVPDAEIHAEYGNLYIVRGEAESYPCIVAHTDQVQKKHSKDFRCYMSDGKVYGFSVEDMEMQGLGADDKNGIWVALKCLEKYPVMKCAFFCGEEVGCVGSSDADMAWFKDCRWVVQCDRKNGGDLITDASFVELCSKEFAERLLGAGFGYKETQGMMTDVMTLKEQGLGVSCVNMSCGYYRPHTDGEYTKIAELENCLAFVQWIVENVTDVYEHRYEKRYGGSKGFGDYDDWYGYGYGGYWGTEKSGKDDDDDLWYGYDESKEIMSDDELAEYAADCMWNYPDMTEDDIVYDLRYMSGRNASDVRRVVKAVIAANSKFVA